MTLKNHEALLEKYRSKAWQGEFPTETLKVYILKVLRTRLDALSSLRRESVVETLVPQHKYLYGSYLAEGLTNFYTNKLAPKSEEVKLSYLARLNNVAVFLVRKMRNNIPKHMPKSVSKILKLVGAILDKLLPELDIIDTLKTFTIKSS